MPDKLSTDFDVDLFSVAAGGVSYVVASSQFYKAPVAQNFQFTDEASQLVDRPTPTLGILFSLNLFLSDAVVIWRAWVLVNRKCHIVLGILTLGSAVATVLLGVCNTNDVAILNTSIVGLIASLLLLLTNVTATMMITHKFWLSHQASRYPVPLSSSMKPDINAKSQNQAEKILLVLIESGFFYLVMWVSTMVIQFGPFDRTAVNIQIAILPHLIAIYPLLTFLLVACKKSEIDMLAQQSEAKVQALAGKDQEVRCSKITEQN
ncbi:hypothetical protein VKT23_010090 [Stygiomarasmius scandens]|uniref:Uncharacterized protein n=1 Tax=Marasmiellus scandens TaxID=2682957 RepID=A0ABR1JEN8_9AGAR